MFIDIHLVDHCNLNCKGCNHYAPIADPNFCDTDKVIENLGKLRQKGILRFVDIINLIGGEPLLNPYINDIIEKAGKILKNGKTRLRIITNGVLLPKMNESFWNMVLNYNVIISVTRYPINFNYEEVEKLCKRKKVEFEIFGNRDDKDGFSLFRLKQTDHIPDSKELTENYNKCFFQCLQLADSKLYICPPSAYHKILNKKFNTDFQLSKGDYLNIDEINILKFLRFRIKSKKFCRYCQFPIPNIDWGITQKKAKEWIIE